jgi:hypothetical protein
MARATRDRRSSGGNQVAASTDILIGDPMADHVVIRPLGRSTPGLFDTWDGNHLDCHIDLSAGAFKGSIQADVRSEDFDAFLQQVEELGRTFEGVAALTGLDGQIALSVIGEADGTVRVTGEAVDAPDSGNRLQFAFGLDRSCLADIASAVQSLLVAFPVLGADHRP